MYIFIFVAGIYPFSTPFMTNRIFCFKSKLYYSQFHLL